MKATPKLLGASLPALEKGGLLLTLAWLACAQSACALRPSVAWPSMLSASSAPTERCILITGANKGQGFALCKRILAEHGDTHVFLCSRDARRGEEAAARLASLLPEAARRVDVVPLDVTEDGSVSAARSLVERKLDGAMLYGVVSNAGVMWGHSRRELMDVCALGVRRVLDAFVPLTHQARGRVVVVSSGLGPLMHGYASQDRKDTLLAPGLTWDMIQEMIDECLDQPEDLSALQTVVEAFEAIGFPGGPFAEAAPDFHMYGLAKMFADAYMLSVAAKYPSLHINSCDPGLVYTDLIVNIPRYQGKTFEETGAKTPEQGVEVAMRLLFDDVEDRVGLRGGMFYAMSKDMRQLLCSKIDRMPFE